MSGNSSKQKNDFLVQGAILGVASIIVRVIGLIYRVPLNNILGEKGVAYYGVAYDVYSILLLLSSYSMPLAVSKMVSARVAVGDYKNTRKIFYSTVVFAFFMGCAAFAITFFGADLFAKILNYPQSALALRVLSPALVILSVLGVLRGYFQGLGTMVPTSVSNIVEQIINAIVSIVAAKVLYNSALDMADQGTNLPESYGAAGGTLGTVAGALAGLIFMVVLFMAYKGTMDKRAQRDKDRESIAYKAIFRTLIITIVPVILSTTIYNIGSLLDSGFFSNIMSAKGTDQDTIDTLTGMYTGNYRVIINVPIALANALASSLIPSVVASVAQSRRGEIIRKIDSVVKTSMMIAMPCAVGIGVLAKPIVNLLFPSSVDPDKVALMLRIGCIVVVLYSLSTITNSILQGIDHMKDPVLHAGFSLLIHIAFLSALLYITGLNVYALVIADMLFALMMCILNQRSLKRYLSYRQEVKKTFVMPAVCSVIMGIAAYFINMLLYRATGVNAFSVLVSIVAAALLYGVLLLLLKVVDEEDLDTIPGGRKIAAVGKKLHLLK